MWAIIYKAMQKSQSNGTIPKIWSTVPCSRANQFPKLINYHHHITTVLWPLFRDHPGEPVPEENFWTLRCKGRLTEADTLTIRLGATPSGLTSAYLHHAPIFYGLDALPAAQPTATKHWRLKTYQLSAQNFFEKTEPIAKSHCLWRQICNGCSVAHYIITHQQKNFTARTVRSVVQKVICMW